MQILPQGRVSKISVHPKNWQTVTSIKEDWYIHYRFYSDSEVKRVVIKGMNEYRRPEDRRLATKTLLENEKDMLFNKGYNPILKAFEVFPDSLSKSLDHALSVTQCKHNTRLDIKSVLKYFNKAAEKLFPNLVINDVKRKHIRQVLDSLNLSDNNFNRYRKYLSKLFSELVELEQIEFNPVKEIAKRKTVRRIKAVISAKERLLIDQHLRKKGLTSFRLYMRIFFHSGCRSSELLSIKAKDVNIEQGYFVCTIQKGKQVREVRKTIKDISLRYWRLALRFANHEDYIFSEGLKPGKTPIRPDQITKRWTRLKKELKITQGFYSLKHSHTTEVVDISDTQTAATINGHTSTGMVVKIYDTKASKREHERIKGLTNSFI